ncbi:hypothetical protein [Ornithinimicrobium sp. INDO-MA30-4]|uniref:hypothetical protein n=1 Tax=Ornithinimicrobium sp. INDO-MA30-4 TaxID=2908651 RepID=UPI001F25FABC|nr:hypothetical protein [Ornithinimicrobium sp. INDO-MA30-4]UJH70081.1 hypothetical protein L0A91_12875 [Ornithinimicrobium sp. INDO-MA30-4]
MIETLEAWQTVLRWKSENPPSDQESDQQSSALLATADCQLPRDPALAIILTAAAMELIFHRSRTAEVDESPLVSDTARHLAALRSSHTWTRLGDESRPRPGAAKVRGRRVSPGKLRLLVMPGAYGQFHQDVVNAVGGFASIQVAKTLSFRDFTKRRPSSSDLLLLDAMRQGRVDLAEQTIDGEPVDDPLLARYVAALAHLAKLLRRRDVVLGDWGDAATMWASHLRPKGTRYVTRLHSLDLLDPWIHLIDWRGVDAVAVANPSMGSLFTQLVGDRTKSKRPQVVQPYRPDLSEEPAPKTAGASGNLGMVGWGRKVKHVDFALDLLERDPARRLVLIGPGFDVNSDRDACTYQAQVQHRIATLGDRVQVVGQTSDVRSHLADIGFIISSSTREGWHLGLIEGAASGSVPIVRDWPLLDTHGGAAQFYPAEWVVNDVAEADKRIREVVESGWEQASGLAREQALAHFDHSATRDRLLQVVMRR